MREKLTDVKSESGGAPILSLKITSDSSSYAT
jgi:hypothetical protein